MEQFGVLPGSDYCRLMQRLFADIEESGGDWLCPDNLDGQKVEIEVATVTSDHRREARHGREQYSKVERIVDIVTG